MKSKELVMFDIAMPSVVDLPEKPSSSERDPFKDLRSLRNLKRKQSTVFEKVVQISPEDEVVVVEVHDNPGSLQILEVDEGQGLDVSYVECNPFDVYNNDQILQYRHSRKAPTTKASADEDLIQKNVNTDPIRNDMTKMVIDFVDMDDLRQGTICMSERKRRKRNIVDLSAFSGQKLVIDKILDKRQCLNVDSEEEKYEYLIQLKNFKQDKIWVSESVCQRLGKRQFNAFNSKLENGEDEFEECTNQSDELVQELARKILKALKHEGKLKSLDTEKLSLDTLSGKDIGSILEETSDTIFNHAVDVEDRSTDGSLPEDFKQVLDQQMDYYIGKWLKSSECALSTVREDQIREELKLRKEIIKFAKYINQ